MVVPRAAGRRPEFLLLYLRSAEHQSQLRTGILSKVVNEASVPRGTKYFMKNGAGST
jgi:hypothetical protein